MFTFLNIIGVIAALLLIFVVTIQESKGGGLASGFSGANNVIGVRRSTDMIEKITWWLAGIMCVLCIVVAKWTPTAQQSINSRESVINDYVDQATIPAPADAQPFGDAQPITPAEAPAETPAEAPAEAPAE